VSNADCEPKTTTTGNPFAAASRRVSWYCCSTVFVVASASGGLVDSALSVLPPSNEGASGGLAGPASEPGLPPFKLLNANFEPEIEAL